MTKPFAMFVFDDDDDAIKGHNWKSISTSTWRIELLYNPNATYPQRTTLSFSSFIQTHTFILFLLFPSDLRHSSTLDDLGSSSSESHGHRFRSHRCEHAIQLFKDMKTFQNDVFGLSFIHSYINEYVYFQ